MKKLNLWPLILLCLALGGCKSSADAWPKINVFTGADMFPPEWRKAPYNATGSEPDSREFSGVLPLALRRVLQVYDQGATGPLFPKIVAVSNFTLNGNAVACATYEDNTYLNSNTHIDIVLHEEIARKFLREHPDAFDESKWIQLNKSGFTYAGNGKPLFHLKGDPIVAPEHLKDGFINERAKNSFADDVIVTAGFLFGNVDTPTIRQNPILLKKAILLVECYKKIDPQIDSNPRGGGFLKALESPD